MSTISAKDVKRLRDSTGVGMMDCKKALAEANGDFEGVITTATSDDATVGVLAEVNSETDFVARNDDFVGYAERITALILRERPAGLDALKALDFEGGRTVGESLIDMTGKIGEKIEVRRFEVVDAGAGNQIVTYIHPGAKLGVLVEMQGANGVADAGRDVAMQVAAMNPVAANRDEVPEEVKQKELEIGRETARNEGKPDHILDRIATGKLERFYKDNVLVDQPFVKDSSMTVKEMLAKGGTDVVRYVRYGLGS
ncbi:MAG: translation elongation factor Ts [Bacteroidota bacterium]